MFRSSRALSAREASSEKVAISELSEPRRWWRRPEISPFLKDSGAAWVEERREIAATVMAAEESFIVIACGWC